MSEQQKVLSSSSSSLLASGLSHYSTRPGADPGFPVGVPPTLQGKAPAYKFSKNCMKLRKFWSGGEGVRAGAPPLEPPLTTSVETLRFVYTLSVSINAVTLEVLVSAKFPPRELTFVDRLVGWGGFPNAPSPWDPPLVDMVGT